MHLTLPQKPGLMFSWVRNSSLQILTLCPKRFSVCVFTYSQSWKISACRICSTIYMIRSSIKSRPKKKQGGAGALPRLCVIQFYLGYLFHSAFQFRILFWESASLLFFLVTIHSWYGMACLPRFLFLYILTQIESQSGGCGYWSPALTVSDIRK